MFIYSDAKNMAKDVNKALLSVLLKAFHARPKSYGSSRLDSDTTGMCW